MFLNNSSVQHTDIISLGLQPASNYNKLLFYRAYDDFSNYTSKTVDINGLIDYDMLSIAHGGNLSAPMAALARCCEAFQAGVAELNLSPTHILITNRQSTTTMLTGWCGAGAGTDFF